MSGFHPDEGQIFPSSLHFLPHIILRQSEALMRLQPLKKRLPEALKEEKHQHHGCQRTDRIRSMGISVKEMFLIFQNSKRWIEAPQVPGDDMFSFHRRWKLGIPCEEGLVYHVGLERWEARTCEAFVPQTRAVMVERPPLNPDGSESRRLFLERKPEAWWKSFFLVTWDGNGTRSWLTREGDTFGWRSKHLEHQKCICSVGKK